MSVNPWAVGYFDQVFSKSDPWKYFASPYEQLKYQRQLQIIHDRTSRPERILEIGSAEGAMTIQLARQFPDSQITCIEISSNALNRARENLKSCEDRVELINSDIIEYEPRLENGFYDVCICSEIVYYLGAQLSLNRTYDLLGRIVGKLKHHGLLVMANTVDIPGDVPESVLTIRPLIDIYHTMISSHATSASRAVYFGGKGGRIYEYQIWSFIK